MSLDAVLQKLQNQPAWNIPRFEEQGGRFVPVPWYDVTGAIVFTVAIRDADLETQIEELSAQVQFWGRMESVCERALEWHSREIRIWKGAQFARIKAPPGDQRNWKKPTDKEAEGIYRNLPEYVELNDKIDQAREALTSTKYVREAFQIKATLVKQYVRRSIDDGRARVQV